MTRFVQRAHGQTASLPLLLVAVVHLASPTWAAPVFFPDANLKAAVESALGVADPDPADMLGLASLSASSAGIVDLTGLETAANLSFLSLPNNQISDISPLSGLTGLTSLRLNSNQISDISVLAGLSALADVRLANNLISDVSALTGHTSLTVLILASNPLSNLAYCRDLPVIESNNPGMLLIVDPNPSPSCNGEPIADAGQAPTVECAFSAGTSVTLNGSGSSDPDGDPLTFSWSAAGIDFDDPSSATPTAAFPLGMTTVALIVADPSGESDTDQVVVTVEDTSPPTVSVTASPAFLWPPNHKYSGIALTVSVSDCDPAPVVSATVISSEVDDASGKGDGKTTGDIRATTAGGSILVSSNAVPQVDFSPVNDALELRAERSGGGDGRVYTIVVTALDGSGNSASSTATVAVDHDQGSAKIVASSLDFEATNYPNPFNPSTTIRYSLPEPSSVRLTIYSVLGQRVRQWGDTVSEPGVYSVEWDGRDGAGRSVAPGVYLYRLEAGQQAMVRKMVLTQ